MAVIITENCTGCTACTRVCPVEAISGERKVQHKVAAGLCIECGACGRICPGKAVADADGRIIRKMRKQLWLRPVINDARCYACGNCVAACPASALAMKSTELGYAENTSVLLRPEDCVSCGWCVENCQFDAIVLEAADEDN